MSLFSDIANSIATNAVNNIAFGKPIADINTVRSAASQIADRYVSPTVRQLGNQVFNSIQNAQSNIFRNAVGGIPNTRVLSSASTPLLGGISLDEARRIYDEAKNTKFSKKNLWLLEVSSNLKSDFSHTFNLFATEVDYAPFTISGEKKKVGAAHVDLVNSADPIELRITTMDDINGTVKNWFKAHCQATAKQDGTVGVPNDYAINITVYHGIVTKDNGIGYQDFGRFRAANLENSLSRREDSMQEIQLSFVQLDTFLK